jgi:hypothetical protein
LYWANSVAAGGWNGVNEHFRAGRRGSRNIGSGREHGGAAIENFTERKVPINTGV